MERLVIEGKNYISSKRAAELMGYTQDYIGQLARGGKISAERVSGIWYVNEDEFIGLSKKNKLSSKNVEEKKDFVVDSTYVNKDEKTNKINTQGQPQIKKDKNNITLDGVDYISSKRAAEIMGYTQDYVGQLCRAKKIESRQIGRGWYIPKSVVYKSIEGHKEKSTPQKEDFSKQSTQKNVLDDIVVFTKVADSEKVSPALSEIKDRETKDKTVTPLHEEVKNDVPNREVVRNIKSEEVQRGIQKKEQEDDSYYYPSFLNAKYSFDDTPLAPTPKRVRHPVLHEIVSRSDNAVSAHNVPIRRVQSHREPTVKPTAREKIDETEEVSSSETEKKAIKGIAQSKERSVAIRSPLSLMKVTSMALGVLLFASVATYIPNVSVFSSMTGTIKTVYVLKAPKDTVLKAEVVSSVSEASMLGTIKDAFNSFFEEKIEYRSI